MAKSKKKVSKDAKRYQRHVPVGPMKAPLQSVANFSNADLCRQLEDSLNRRIAQRCAGKEFEQTFGSCATGGGTKPCIDLVVLIDTSGSMQGSASKLSNAADVAIQAAAKNCPSDLRVEWFGIEGTWAGTKFTQSYRDYLQNLPTPVPDADIVGTPGDYEDGAAAIMDISDHFDWRQGCARIIFYLGDEALEGGDPQNNDDVVAGDNAVATATMAGVTVFTYFNTTPSVRPITASEYSDLATETGGLAFTAPIDNIGGFKTVLENIICAPLRETCRPVEEPNIVPCLRMRWGDGPMDQLETEDTEILCLTVCNPYSNVTLKNFTLHLVVTTATGDPVGNLPDGTPSVMIKPDFMICFGDIPACDPKQQNQSSCISREVVLRTRGAIEGKYRVFIAYCFQASFTKLGYGSTFELDLVKD